MRGANRAPGFRPRPSRGSTRTGGCARRGAPRAVCAQRRFAPCGRRQMTRARQARISTAESASLIAKTPCGSRGSLPPAPRRRPGRRTGEPRSGTSSSQTCADSAPRRRTRSRRPRMARPRSARTRCTRSSSAASVSLTPAKSKSRVVVKKVALNSALRSDISAPAALSAAPDRRDNDRVQPRRRAMRRRVQAGRAAAADEHGARAGRCPG